MKFKIEQKDFDAAMQRDAEYHKSNYGSDPNVWYWEIKVTDGVAVLQTTCSSGHLGDEEIKTTTLK